MYTFFKLKPTLRIYLDNSLIASHYEVKWRLKNACQKPSIFYIIVAFDSEIKNCSQSFWFSTFHSTVYEQQKVANEAEWKQWDMIKITLFLASKNAKWTDFSWLSAVETAYTSPLKTGKLLKSHKFCSSNFSFSIFYCLKTL